jgi:hypothetical protein
LKAAHGLAAIETTRQRFSQSFSSPSGKLTHAPELVLPEPKDATAILLQANAIQQLSSRIRSCKANAAFVRSDSLSALQTFCQEQENARGQFPGPVPVVYCGGCDSKGDAAPADAALNGPLQVRMEAVAAAGADGVLVRVRNGAEIRSVEDLVASDNAWVHACQSARSVGLQPIPEIVFSEGVSRTWSEDDVATLVDAVVQAMGGESPVCVLLTVNPTPNETIDNPDDDSNAEPEPLALPTIPKALVKRVPVVGSVRSQAGDGRIGQEASRMKEAGFSSVLLRHDCLPGYRARLNLDIVGHFWASCIDDLKSVKSKSFSFRSKNNMEKNQGTVWANYQNSVIESGALGDPSESYSIVDSSAGEYKGFA